VALEGQVGETRHDRGDDGHAFQAAEERQGTPARPDQRVGQREQAREGPQPERGRPQPVPSRVEHKAPATAQSKPMMKTGDARATVMDRNPTP
jgi:hypothetical protein